MNRGFTYYIRDKTNPDLVYYGSSGKPILEDRMKSHIKNFNSWKKNKNNSYCSSYKVLEKNNYEYDIIEVVYFDTKYELRQYERPLIEGQICVNKEIPNRTDKEYYDANAEYFKEYSKEYYRQNPEQHKKWYETNKDKIKEYNKKWYDNNKEYSKEYYRQNPDKRKKNNAKYREQNIYKINEKAREKITCECGCVIRRDSLSKHRKSIKHQKWVESQIIDK